MNVIRNFVIISHVDHGKSTLADRLLELTGTIERRRMRPQVLDRLDVEREKGITIKMQPVRMRYRTAGGAEVALNLIDTPGHADFSYEVSRALAAVEGAVLLVDATQGVQAQTVANFTLASRQGLAIIPVLNKIDLLNADIRERRAELAALVGLPPEEVSCISAKTGAGVAELIERVVAAVPPPRQVVSGPARALVFDSHADPYRGIVAHVRVMDGAFRAGMRLVLLGTKTTAEAAEVGYFDPDLSSTAEIRAGEIGYVATGLREPGALAVGDTLAEVGARASALPGYRTPRPVVFASVFPVVADEYEKLRDALGRARLNDAALVYEPESSGALGRGFRAGFLGMLHMDITAERLRREQGVVVTLAAPSVAYRVRMRAGETLLISSAARMPEATRIAEIEEPWARLEIVAPAARLGSVLALAGSGRRRVSTPRPIGDQFLVWAEAPLADVIIGFADALKAASSGYASFGTEPIGYRPADVVRLDAIVAGRPEPALAQIVPRSAAVRASRSLVSALKELVPRQLFPVALQASVEGRIIARETIPALKKDVAGYLYGGDRTRKMKLWAKQKRGKARLAAGGRVNIPAEVYRKLLARSITAP